MTKKTIAIAAASLLGAAALYSAAKPVVVSLSDAKGQSVGTATLTEGKGGSGVTIKLNLKGLPPGEHALHIHVNAKCEAPGFTTAGGHFNPDKKKHGLESADGHHAGDMKNFTVDAKGKAKATVMDADVTLADGDHSVFSNGGTALMIHAKADDYKTDPTGNAGDRIACGTITKP
jgi:Cu-Zn family superoxide dismutase